MFPECWIAAERHRWLPPTLLLARVEHGVVFVTLVERVIRAFDKDFGPLDQGSREEPGKSADQDLLEKRGVHPGFYSNDGASNRALRQKFGMRVADFPRK